jgi:hypothetical protein
LLQTGPGPVPKSGPGNLVPKGLFEGLETASSQVGPKGLKPLIPPVSTEEAHQTAPPLTCPAGQELDEDTNLCVPVSQEQGVQQQQEGSGEQSSNVNGGESGDNNDQQQSDDGVGGSDGVYCYGIYQANPRHC